MEYADLLNVVSLGRRSFSFGATALMTPWMRVEKSDTVAVGMATGDSVVAGLATG